MIMNMIIVIYTYPNPNTNYNYYHNLYYTDSYPNLNANSKPFDQFKKIGKK